jgi:hypothetical protein
VPRRLKRRLRRGHTHRSHPYPVKTFKQRRELRGCQTHHVCGNPERHEYELYLAVEDIDHSRTKTKSPQTNGINCSPNIFARIAPLRRCPPTDP